MKNRINDFDHKLLATVENNPSYKVGPFYHLAYPSPSSKGAIYEKIVTAIYESMGIHVTKRTHSDHDRVINHIKSEIKGAMWTKGGKTFKFNQVRFVYPGTQEKKDWDEIIFLCVGPDYVRMFKDTWHGLVEKGITTNQHGGEGVQSGTDWFTAGIDFMEKTFEEV